MNTEATAIGGFLAVPIDQIQPSENNPRDHLYDVESLAASIKELGLIQPLIVQRLESGAFQIIAGHRRHAALQLLGQAVVPCVVRRAMLPDAELCAMLVENGQRAGLDPIEEARALNRLMESEGLTLGDVSRRVGRPLSFVSSRLMLLQLPEREQEQVRAGHFTITYANGLVRAARKAQRDKSNPTGEQRPVGRPKGASTKPYFGDTHPLASAVRARCSHRGSPKVNGVGCGACWEAVIREDELAGLGGAAS